MRGYQEDQGHLALAGKDQSVAGPGHRFTIKPNSNPNQTQNWCMPLASSEAERQPIRTHEACTAGCGVFDNPLQISQTTARKRHR